MIYIYRLIEKDGDMTNELLDTWDDGKFKKSDTEMDRKDVLNEFNRGYYFTSEDEETDKKEKE